MGNQIKLSQETTDWLIENHDKYTYTYLAKRVGCCVDTLKRILVRLDLQEFDGAKYVTSREAPVKKWNRPCLDCGSKESRPVNWYFCKNCRSNRGYQD